MNPRLLLVWIVTCACSSAGRGPTLHDADPNVQRHVPTDTLRIVAYNIHHGEGMDDVIDLERIGRLITGLRPDLVALQEVDNGVERTNGVDQTNVLGTLTDLSAQFGAFMPYQGGNYGMGVLSAWPVVTVENHRLPDGEEPRSALAVRVRSPHTGRELVFVGIHFYRTEAERLAQATQLMDVFHGDVTPSVLAGDFNSQPGSVVLDTLMSMWRFIDKGDDRFTFPSMEPAREIDFVAFRPANAFEVHNQFVLDEPVISDHRPLFVELVWR